VFENRVLRRVFGPKRDKVTGEWRKLHNEELSDLYSLPDIVRVVKSRRMRWAGHVARMGEGRGVHRVLVGKHLTASRIKHLPFLHFLLSHKHATQFPLPKAP
jgi:hypothetical protein